MSAFIIGGVFAMWIALIGHWRLSRNAAIAPVRKYLDEIIAGDKRLELIEGSHLVHLADVLKPHEYKRFETAYLMFLDYFETPIEEALNDDDVGKKSRAMVQAAKNAKQRLPSAWRWC